MAINQILPFGTVSGANVLAPADYQALAARLGGFSVGTAKSKELNTVWRQASFVAAMIGQYIADKAGQDVLDNGDLAALQAKFVAALAASPALTGVPTAPTAAAGTNTDQLATTRFVTQQLSQTIPWMSQANLPTTDKGPIYVAERKDIWTWVNTAYYTGYRSPLCGAIEYGHTTSPLPWQLDAMGGRVLKSDHPRLLAYAQENALLVPAASWAAGALVYADEGTQIRLPDLQNMFLRFTGADVDTANARLLGKRQADAAQRVTGSWMVRPFGTNESPDIAGILNSSQGAISVTSREGSGGAGRVTPLANDAGGGVQDLVVFDSSRVSRTSAETRPTNIAAVPRLHM
ncbi:hypothetical protein I6I07_29700 [Achromobacter deleyi]|uniref:Phage tail collar domain-containing protein n=1 Tax=Achromobacter deleyi TaxID=1353891 RepID=A0A7T4B2W4_9BURK|nr:hypothetical protein [Achromobacter deleyi]QQB34691.1 hypothetical protein I6I07_29700 [Achromobacter deleyi]